MDALEAAKDVIRRKYSQLKVETADVITRASKAETSVVHETTSASDEEKRIRELSKTVSKKENELDIEQAKLEAVEKKIKVTEINTKRNNEDIAVLNNLTTVRETELQQLEEKFSKISAESQDTGTRVDRSEKKRKELEHICNFNEERIEKDEKELIQAKKTTRDAYEKYEETTRRLNVKEKALGTASKRVNGAGNRLDQLENDMLEIAKKMGKSATTRENAAKREDALKKKLGQLNRQVLEAESRARHMEEEQNKLEILVGQMNEEKIILGKMREKKSTAQTLM